MQASNREILFTRPNTIRPRCASHTHRSLPSISIHPYPYSTEHVQQASVPPLAPSETLKAPTLVGHPVPRHSLSIKFHLGTLSYGVRRLCISDTFALRSQQTCPASDAAASRAWYTTQGSGTFASPRPASGGVKEVGKEKLHLPHVSSFLLWEEISAHGGYVRLKPRDPRAYCTTVDATRSDMCET